MNTEKIASQNIERVKRPVKILTDTVVNQIAAGEVVERPASVVKELVENSIDAGATSVTVILDNGGHSNIEVIDNGWGMELEDAVVAVERFGTSKIRSTDDIFHIDTLGFRGEALPSIAAVSKFTLTTRAAEDGVARGVEICIDGGGTKEIKELPCGVGTRIQVRQLFFNVPARRRFLKSERAEKQVVKALLIDFALAHPHLRISLLSDGAESLSFLPSESFFARVRELKLTGNGEPLVVNDNVVTPCGTVRVEAVLCRPIEAVAGSGRLRFIVNGRIVRDRLLIAAARDGYANFLKPGKYPQGALKIEVPSEEVDVNVHPQKTEVRFREPSHIFLAVSRAIKRALEISNPMPSYSGFGSIPLSKSGGPFARFNEPQVQPRVEFFPAAAENANRELVSDSLAPPAESPEEEFDVVTDGPQQSASNWLEGNRRDEPSNISRRSLADMRVVGQVFNCYIILEDKGELLLVDMHAAHERVMFTKLKQQFFERNIARQSLLIPETVSLPAEAFELFNESQEDLRSLGFECEVFGENSVVIRSIPTILGNVQVASIFKDLFAEEHWSDWKSKLLNSFCMVIATCACHASVRKGRKLEMAEILHLLKDLEDVESSHLCPHGRPVVAKLDIREIERMFGRTS
ncbi:MAG: DNA mismatch repair endonuclease MutL [Deltaproteobacteria bacterium]|nr:DNA mismatch repair endonuclease MutL [Deltaproteobacteria bacterium]